MNRREFLKVSGGAGAIALMGTQTSLGDAMPKGKFSISLAQWSLHRALRGGKMTNLDFPKLAAKEFGIYQIEYVNQFFKDKANNSKYLKELKNRCEGEGVKSILIMIDGEGQLGAETNTGRLKTIDNHKKWIDAAKFLGAHSIRVNAGGPGDRETLKKAVVDGLSKLSEYGAKQEMNVIVENHGGFSSDGDWLESVITEVGMPNCGTLPDFGNFCIKRERDPSGNRICTEEYDRYKGTAQLMPFAKAVSAKSYNFDADGNETTIDYHRMMKIVLDAGYHGAVGIEYEGRIDDEHTGIRKTKALLERILKT